MIGRTLSHFQITARLGEGGMGEVWLAADQRLGREVAIKVLPEAFTSEPDRLARFEREARVLASLTHSNIAAIHDVGEQEGTHFLVMELAPGETLADRIARGPIPLKEAVAIAGQIADAVSVAHEQGVVHRDLKPGNVMVTPDGSVKVLDFGLAKALTPQGISGSSPELSLSPTMTFQATAVGMLLGTAAYMSPEQAKGRPVDRRSDVWSFGCVLFEMLSGRPVFHGETVTEILAAILRAEPDWHALPADLPPGVISVLRYCLTKDSNQRLRDVADARLLLEEALESPKLETPASSSRRREGLAWGLAAAALISALALGLRSPMPEPNRPATQFDITLAENAGLELLDQPILAFSPDGQTIALVANDPSTNQARLFLRNLDGIDPIPLYGTEGASSPFFSPDGLWLGFFAEGKVKKIALSGGPAVALAEAQNPRGAVWMPDGTILYSPLYTSGLWSVPAVGGVSEAVLELDEEAMERTFRWPDLLPEGRGVLFTVGSSDSPNDYNEASIDVWIPGTGKRHRLIEGANMARFSAPDRVLFSRDNMLHIARIDLQSLEILGAARPVVEGVLGDPSSGACYFALAANGSLAFVPGSESAENSSFFLIERDGSVNALELEPAAFHHPRFSPDGSQLAFTIGRGRSGSRGDIWTYSLSSSERSRLTFDEAGIYPLWSPTGDEIAYTAAAETIIPAKASDGTGTTRIVAEFDTQGIRLPASWSPDGRTLAYTVLERQTNIYLSTENQPHRLFETDASNPAFSPDGRWIAYAQPASGNSFVYVRPFEGEGKWQISPDVGGYPRWPAFGDEIFYVASGGPKRSLMAVKVTGEQALRFGAAQVVIEDTSLFTTSTAPLANWDVSPDGKRFIMVELVRGEAAGSEIRVFLDWAGQPEISGL